MQQLELALAKLGIQLQLSKCLKSHIQMFLMRFTSPRIDYKHYHKLIEIRLRTRLMRSIKAAGALVNPNGITRNSY